MLILIAFLVAGLIFAIADKKIQKAGDLCLVSTIIPSMIITEMLARRFSSGNSSSNKYYFKINGMGGAGTITTDSLLQILGFFVIMTALTLGLAKLGEIISKKVFKKENDGEKYDKIGTILMIVGNAIVGLVGLDYLYFGIMSKQVTPFIYAAIILTVAIYQLKKYLIDKNYNTKKVI